MSKNYQFFLKTDVSPYIGEWIVICKERVVAHGKNVEEVFRKAKNKYPKERPFLARIPDKEAMIF
ncbi:MAG TPA: DUF5678 domain-containing protein [Candidatus Nanoarchaeia archaeon]|nr:DUF5678 domain-containing protein [Candidatus Nanoarchaeia archaeon]